MLAKISEVLFGGTRGFNQAEQRLLSFLPEALSVQDHAILSAQLKSVRKVQRQQPGKLLAVYYRPGHDVPRLPYSGDEYCLAIIRYRSNVRVRATALVLHDGRFSTLERNVPKSLAEIGALVSVALHPGGFKSITGQIDMEEHAGIELR